MKKALRYGGFVFCMLVLGYFSVLCFSEKRFDFWRHVAIVASFERSPLHPEHESMSDSQDALEVHTPYHWAIALVARATNLSPFRALQWAGVFNWFLLVVSLRVFFRRYFVERWHCVSACAIFLALALFLRFAGYAFSGELSFAGIQLTETYPSFTAIGMLLILYSLTQALLERPRGRDLLALSPLLSLILLTHPLSGSFGILQTAVQIGVSAYETRAPSKVLPRVIAGLFAIGASAALTLAWPYYSIFRWGSNLHYGAGELAQYEQGLWSTGAAYLLCAPLLFVALRTRGVRALAFILFGGALVHGISYFSGRYFLSRYIFLTSNIAYSILTLAAMQALTGAEVFPRATRLCRIIGAFALASILCSPENWRRIPESIATFRHTFSSSHRFERQSLERFALLRSELNASDVVIASSATGFLQDQIAYWTGAKSVDNLFCFTHPQYQTRLRSARCVFSACGKLGRREKILNHYHVSAIIIDRKDPESARIDPTFYATLAKVSAEDENFTVYRWPQNSPPDSGDGK